MWRNDGHAIYKEFKFDDFKSALEFVNQIGELADSMNHHPDIELSWGRVKISLTTHSKGKITHKDYKLAEEIDKL